MQFSWIKRSDLLSFRHESGGWVVKDPLTLNYALLDDVEYRILSLLDGTRNFQTLLKHARQLCPERHLTIEDLGGFLSVLAGHQLVRNTAGGDSQRLDLQSQGRIASHLLTPLLNLLRLQFPLANPSRFLDWSLPIVSVFFSNTARQLFALALTTAALLVLLRFGELTTALPTLQEFLGPQNVVLIMIVFVVVKVFHEAGHAYTARHFGAECHECGIMLMVFTPVLYTNVSDAWILPRRQRLLVTAAGILVELAIASVATLLWWYAAPGLTKTVLLNIMLMCSLNTLLFNGNPLLRFDGYFLLADWLNVPNLAPRSSIAVQQFVIQLMTGRSDDAAETASPKHILLGYGFLSAIYRLFLTFAILHLVREICEQWQVTFIGEIISGLILIGFLALPAIRFLSNVFSEEAMQNYKAKNWGRILLSAVAVLAVALVPLPHNVVAPAVIQPNSAAVFAPLPGQLMPLVNYGQQIHAGTELMTLRNPELEKKRARLKAKVVELQLQLNSLISNPATANSELLPTLRESINGAENQLAEFETEFAGLSIISPSAGTFLPPPATAKADHDNLPRQWNGVPVQPSNTGAWIERGTLLGYVGDTGDVKFLACVAEADVEFLEPGLRGQYIDAGGNQSDFTLVADNIGTANSKELPLPMAVAGVIDGRVTENGIIPSAVTYVVTLRLSTIETMKTANPPSLYSVGTVRIRTKPMSVLHRCVRYLRRTFS